MSKSEHKTKATSKSNLKIEQLRLILVCMLEIQQIDDPYCEGYFCGLREVVRVIDEVFLSEGE